MKAERLYFLILAVILLIAGCRKSPTVTNLALHNASRKGNLEQMKVLLASGADINAKDEWGETPLHASVGSGDPAVVELLVAGGADVNIRNNVGDTPLIYSAKETSLGVVKALVASGADIHVKGLYLNTPLHWAAEGGHKDIVQLLIDSGADVNVPNRRGERPADLAMKEGHLGIVRLLVSKGADVTLQLAAYMGDLKGVKELIDSGTDVNEEDQEGRTPLHWAAKEGHRDIVELLLAGGANPNSRELIRGATPLHLALEQGHEDAAAILIANRADVSAEYGQLYRTPLHIAASLGLRDTAALLIARGADVNASSQAMWEGADWTPLRYAVERGHVELVRLLLDNGASVNETTRTGVTMAVIAMYKNKWDIVQLLLSRGAEATVHLAAYVGDLDTTRNLLENGVDVNLRDECGSTALLYAAEYGHRDIAELLIARGASVNPEAPQDSYRQIDSPLHLAAYGGHTDVVALLIATGAEVDARDSNRATPLCLAALGGHKDVAELLLARGAGVDAEAHDRRTALYEAAHGGYRDVVELLLSRGADVKAGRVGIALAETGPPAKTQAELAEQVIAACRPYCIIVHDPKSVREYLRYNGIDYDELWIPEQAELECIDPVLRSHLQNKVFVGAKEHFNPVAILLNLNLYNREYSGITRNGRRYIICQMIIHDLSGDKPQDIFRTIHGSANGVVRFVFDVENKKIVQIDCEYVM